MGRKKWQIDQALKLWRVTHWAKRVAHRGPFRAATGMIASKDAFSASFVPVSEDIDVPSSVPLPRELLADFITRACNRTIIDFCPCRTGEGCEKYPRDMGCMLLGRGSMDVDPGVGHRATVEEALAYADRAIELGLLPLIGHIRIDRYVFGIKDYSKMLTICFCCRCCCVIRSEMKGLIGAFPDSIVRLEGVHVDVGEDCTGCGQCVSVCPIENISLENGIATIGDRCLGCGTCAGVCDNGQLSLVIEPDARLLEDIRRRVEAGVDIEK
jgi:UDP-glucose 4-epimerase